MTTPRSKIDTSEVHVWHSHDVILREHGWQIAARPKGKPAIWRRGAVVMEQDKLIVDGVYREPKTS